MKTTPHNTLGECLKKQREKINLTVQAVADRAGVAQSLVSGLQTGSRRCGEDNAKRIAVALEMNETQQREFAYLALNSSVNRVLQENMSYPAEVLNMVANGLNAAGIGASQISQSNLGNNAATFLLNDGRQVAVSVFIK
jgi:transcriptional regulator with XRE-family HTH domain